MKFTGISRSLFTYSLTLISLSLSLPLLVQNSLDIWYFCRYTSFFAVGVGVLLFLLTSFSNPGTVTADNVSLYLSAYPYDDVIYSKKECSTCKIQKWVLPPPLPHYCFGDFSLRFSFSVLIFFFLCGSDLLGLSIAVYVVAVWPALTIIVDGWFEILQLFLFLSSPSL